MRSVPVSLNTQGIIIGQFGNGTQSNTSNSNRSIAKSIETNRSNNKILPIERSIAERSVIELN